MMARKTNDFGTPGIRLLNFYTLLCASNRKYSLTRLAQIFRCSRQAILRMVEQIERVRDVELNSWLEEGERYYQVKTRPATVVALDPQAIQQLVLVRDLVKNLLPRSIAEELSQVVGAATVLSPTDPDVVAAVAEAKTRGSINYAPFQKALETLQIAMRQHRVCRLQYRPRLNAPCKALKIAPLRLMLYRDALYVRCYACDTHGNRTFEKLLNLAVHRMSKLVATETSFDLDADDSANDNFGLDFSPPLKVRVAFAPDASTYVAERTWSRNQHIRRQRDGGIILTFTTTSRPETVSWILGFGPNAKVLEPEDLKQEVVQAMKTAVGQYQT